ncbi:ABC transporter substrate-binding protein [Microbacterium indicum]|uniref:ABC transporter substrate-binding protein n=1 Tax=Microbacterium indicum TaxID=358100 RepID=UPI0003FA3F79|nr:extracellular solute-binding protein [Microbacterium indicum]
MKRTRLLTIPAVLAVGGFALAGCSAATGEPDADTLVVSTFPFGVEQMQEAIFDPFTEATGIEVEVETGSNADRISQLELMGGEDPGIDVMMISDYYAALGQDKGLFQQVDESKVPALGDIADFAIDDAYMGPAYSYQLDGTLYRTDELSAEDAASWDLWGDDSYAGKLALPDISVTAGQLAVSGVGATRGSGPYDVDTAFDVMGDWAPNMLQFYSSTTEVTNLIVQNEIVAANTISGFATDLMAQGEPVAWTAPDGGAYMATNRLMIPEGAANVDAAHQFIDFVLSAETQSKSAELVGDLPVNPDATIPDEIDAVVGDIAADPIAAGYETLDPAELTPTRNEWVDRFAREVTSK